MWLRRWKICFENDDKSNVRILERRHRNWKYRNIATVIEHEFPQGHKINKQLVGEEKVHQWGNCWPMTSTPKLICLFSWEPSNVFLV